MQSKIFKHTYKNVLNGSKTETSRIRLPYHEAVQISQLKWAADIERPDFIETERYISEIWNMNNKSKFSQYHRGRILWKQDAEFGIKPKYGAPAIAKCRVICISPENILEANEKWARAEGFNNVAEFWEVWATINDPSALDKINKILASIETLPESAKINPIRDSGLALRQTIDKPQTTHKWHCWRIRFKLIEIYPIAQKYLST